MINRWWALFFLVITVNAVPSYAEDRQFPLTEQVEGITLIRNGVGIRTATIFHLKVYYAALYLKEKSPNPEEIVSSSHPKKLIMRFVRAVEKDKLTSAWEEGFKQNVPLSDSLKATIAEFVSSMRDMHEEDELQLVILPQKVILSLSGQIPKEIKGEEFARTLLLLWLGPNPPNEELKQGLLGANS